MQEEVTSADLTHQRHMNSEYEAVTEMKRSSCVSRLPSQYG